MRYRDAGVDLSRSEAAKARIAAAVRSTWDGRVRPIEGGFAGIMDWPGGGPRLLAATLDGVGTKLHVALALGRVADATADLVRHGANDLLVHGAEPLAFLDYLAQGRLDPDVVAAAVEGIARGCREVGAVLLGGETAEMPDTYLPEVVDVAGCMVGTAAAATLLDGSQCRAGDQLLGLASAGLHTNGYSLARRIVAQSGLALDAPLPGGRGERIGDALMAPHRWYGPALLPPVRAGRVCAMAHVTGGGIAGNLVRVLPEGVSAEVDGGAWPVPTLFRWLIAAGSVPEEDARASFNLGIGMVVVAREAEADALARDLEAAGETVFRLGRLTAGTRGVRWID